MTSSPQTRNVTSFKKKGKEILNIKGTRVSVQNAQLLTSTGSSTFDFFIGGGLAIGTICLIEEDYFNTYSTLLLKYFLAEGVVCNHSIFLASGEKDPEQLLKELPAAKNLEIEKKDVKQTVDALSDDLKIAWRYKSQSSAGTDEKSESYNCGFDLSKTMSGEILEKANLNTWNPAEYSPSVDETCDFVEPPYSDLFKTIKSQVLAGFKTGDKTDNVLRIGISSISSPLWHRSEKNKEHLNLIRFLYMLKSLLRTSFAVAVVTLPSFLMKDEVLRSRLHQIGDTVVKLESFVGSNKKSNPLFKDFDGLLHILKLPVLNTFVYNNPTTDLAFKLKRKGFLIERMHLPPDLEEQSGDSIAIGCGGHGSKLDF